MKKRLQIVFLCGLALTATPGGASGQTNDVQPAPNVIPSEIPNPILAPAPISTQPTQSLGSSLQINNPLNSLNSASNLYQNSTTPGCSGSSPLCFSGSVTYVPGVGPTSTFSGTWSPNQPLADFQDQAKKNEMARRQLMMLEARRQVANDLATALEQKQWDRARILAFQLVGAKNYRDYLMRVTGGQFPNP